ncbi:tetratricopeptide repeat protein [Clostridium isatidis]|uniref:tetratricopeptide repeat protein n=1 Tax=Clostridium isatidis TaxID=182773 RepID=UPI003AB0DF69
MNKKLIKQINMLALLTLAISLFACTDINKKITISNNTNKEILLEEDEISELINKGKKLLNDERYDEANAYFNKALELDKSNKNLYLKIKDIYLEANRLDDAYFLIKSAISNNVDVDLVEFYWGTETASKEALKDNKILLYDEDGTPYYPNGYYIRNNDSELITYEISDSCSFQLLPNDFLFLGYELPPSSSYTIPNTASFNDFKNYINLYTPYNNEKTNRRTLCWIELKNGVAYSVYRQFTP